MGGHPHGFCQRIGRENRAGHVGGVQPADGRDLRGGGFEQQRRQDAERIENFLVVAGHIAHVQPMPGQQAAGYVQIAQLVAVHGQLPRVAAEQAIHDGAGKEQQRYQGEWREFFT